MKKYFLLLPILGVLASSCQQKKSVDLEPRTICPASLFLPFHEVAIASSRQIPAKVAVVVDGERKFDECNERPVDDSSNPIVVFNRTGSGHAAIKVLHFGAYNPLPKDVSFEIIDRTVCFGPESTFYSANHVPLIFKTEYPNGIECGAQTFAKVSMEIP